ncbi:MAG: TIGR01212 family radical SAM protein [Sulfuricurvum sp.]|uniref:TIGR01212 family radical SAM protein n=1 Tax=Sulfuricurvum sp. TaxID=2025608 RepID=UPI00262CB672|nr:TIGR01212 family radical SAM protein [Sulfuricurvum sp.]MDD2368960.1 TIGR01212 family radical SAM protein [Sulfuricurvum sp.]MDD2950064.1 TIGR01212 family radical SAM protein [Sulfuricurvum sp.]MDD5117722.1 TIGR01212 family radical SAM protein [Sulfuricurvum sp.]
MREQIFTFGQYLHRKFGAKVSKVPVSISGFTCPNIDGTVAKGGCTFCENDSFSPSLDRARELKGFFLNLHSTTNPHLEKQLQQMQWQFEALSKRLHNENDTEKYMVYFQSFTNTYAPFETLQALYEKALSYENVIGLSIGTRSDSISDQTFEYLAELSKKTEIWVEFGIQSIYDETLVRINRGHDSANVKEAILKAKSYGLNVCGHLIFGLPGETKEMMLETAKEAYALGIDSVKYHPLYVVKRTALANEYARGEFTPISQELYLEVLTEALLLKPSCVSVQRITAGINDDSLIAPQWCRDKNEQFRAVNEALAAVGLKY